MEADKIVHERARLRILVFLATSSQGRASFVDVQRGLGLTGGNLSVQLRVLEEAGYVTIDKFFQGNKPVTEVTLTSTGRQALERHLDELELLIRAVRAANSS